MPYESTGDFLLRATPEEKQKMDEIFKMIKPYKPPEKDAISTRYSTYLEIVSYTPQSTLGNWSSILNIK